MRLSRTTLFVIGCFLLPLPFVIYKAVWLAHAQRVKAEVVAVTKRRRVPVYEYRAEGKTYQSGGHYYLRCKVGDTVELFYKTANPVKTRLASFRGVWLDTFIWCGVTLLCWIIIFLRRDIIPRQAALVVSRRGIKFSGC